MKVIGKKLKDFLIRYAICAIGLLIMAISYNLFYVPNNYVTGGVTGLSIILSKITEMDSSVFIFIGNFFFIVLSLATLGFKKSVINVLGAITFTTFVYLTRNIGALITIEFTNAIFYILSAGVTMGLGAGIVYKVDFTSGGTDILNKIINVKLKRPMGQTNLYISIAIMSIGTFVFGIEMLVSALLIKFIEATIIDRLLLGISDSKMFLINTTKEEEIKKYILTKVESGVTLLEGRGGYTNEEQDMIMCIVPTEKYYKVKDRIKNIDPYAFIIVSDCYEVLGGTKKKKKLPIKIETN